MIVERALPFDHQLSCTIIDYHQLSFSLSLFKFFMIVDDSFSRLATRMIVHDSFSVSCFGNHRPDNGQTTCCRPLSSRKIHIITSLSYGTPFSIRIFTRRSWNSLLSWLCLPDCRWTIVNYHELLWPFDHLNRRIVGDSKGRINYHRNLSIRPF